MTAVIQIHDTTWQLATQPPVASHRAPLRALEQTSMAELLQLMGVDDDDERGAADIPVLLRCIKEGEALFHEGADAESFYFVRAGTFKIYRTAEDGYEQVLGFVGHAEMLGFDALYAGCYPTAAVALEHASVFVLPLREFLALAQRVPALDLAVHRAASSALCVRGELGDVMAAVAAEVRLARFLMHLSAHMAGAGQSPRRFHLRMSRRDIASYLGVAHETVSRSFGALSEWGLVEVDNREVEILAIDSLRDLSRSTRRQVDGHFAHGLHTAAASGATRHCLAA